MGTYLWTEEYSGAGRSWKVQRRSKRWNGLKGTMFAFCYCHVVLFYLVLTVITVIIQKHTTKKQLSDVFPGSLVHHPTSTKHTLRLN